MIDQTQNTVSIFDKLARLYQDKYMDVDLYAVGLDLFCASLCPGADILELACGPGNVTAYVLGKRPDFQILGTDLAPNMIALAQTNNPTARFEIMDCRDIDKLQQNYDAILCAFCLPYLSKDETFRLIADSAQKLNPHGLFYLSTMEDDYLKSKMMTGSTGDKMFQYFHESDYLIAALESSGLEITHHERIRYPMGETSVTDLIIIAKKS